MTSSALAHKEFAGYVGGQVLGEAGNTGVGSGGPTAEHVDSKTDRKRGREAPISL